MNRRLTPELRKRLKAPLGRLSKSPHWAEKVITVGDQCSALALEQGVEPVLMVYDNMIRRVETPEDKREMIESHAVRKETVENPAGTITAEAEGAISLLLSGGEAAKLEVLGEEDLLVLPCVLHAREGTRVYYGQPNEGVVEIEVNEKAKAESKEIMLAMEVIQ